MIAVEVVTGLSPQRDGYAVIRHDWWTGHRRVLGYCRLPSAALRIAVDLTTDAEPGIRYEAVSLGAADVITGVAP